ncbi:glycoside hydrolase family 5 protein [Zunongwangia endophytica]|uniref:Glycoside hydrolase family 5 protein n=1 Tax=Zunongwangia endophytica TaxID=1808945 RepID=A0ABV8H839_9FLAO|nr:cellulase family glycosylhydrolase [Zunongwangia endophytica]MDN3595121.1 cellulase family glycosylhydrolase [Zunongwangia endophytica]
MNFKFCLFAILMLVCFDLSAQKAMDRLKVDHNEFVNAKAEVLVFRGVNTSDPDKLVNDDLWSEDYFKEIKNWGATIVRFPIHPEAWRERGEKEYLKILDQGIEWANKYDLYVILDWHSIGNLKTERYLADMYFTTLQETLAFWKLMAQHYGDNTTVAFYELFNEPTTYNNKFGKISWKEWKEIMEQLITAIRSNGGKGIPLVAGFNWAYDLNPIKKNPINAANIGYVAHPYPQKRKNPWEKKWTNDWGFAKEKYPVILTEIGFCDASSPGAHEPVIGDEEYGDAITNYSDKNNISYLVWVFDKDWSPRMYKDRNFTPSRQGRYFKKKMLSY